MDCDRKMLREVRPFEDCGAGASGFRDASIRLVCSIGVPQNVQRSPRRMMRRHEQTWAMSTCRLLLSTCWRQRPPELFGGGPFPAAFSAKWGPLATAAVQVSVVRDIRPGG